MADDDKKNAPSTTSKKKKSKKVDAEPKTDEKIPEQTVTTMCTPPPNTPIPNTPIVNEPTINTLATKTPSAQQNSENEMGKIQYFLAEAESAPKHLFSHSTQEEFSKILGAYTEHDTSSNPKYQDGPSCSRLITAAYVHTAPPPLNESDGNSPKAIDSDPNAFRTTKSIFKKEPEVDVDPTYGTFKPIDTENGLETTNAGPTPASSVRSLGSLVCRICHNSENPERLVSPCLCKGTLSFVHIHCLERWISTSRSTVCELCQYQYNTEQTLRYTCMQSLRMWYSRSMSRRALQEDCQMFSLLTLVAFGIIGTLLVGIQYYFIQGRHWGLSSMWTKGWLLFFLFTTLLVYFINIYMILRSQLAPWYRWWQSARDIKLILENRKPFKILPGRRMQGAKTPQESQQSATNAEQQPTSQSLGDTSQAPTPTVQQQQQQQQQPMPLSSSPPQPQPIALMPLPLPSPSASASPTPMQSVNKLEISSESTRRTAEIIEIPYDVYDSYAPDSIATNV